MSTDLNMEYQEVKFGEIAKHISKRVEPSETTLEIYVGLEHLDPDSLKITRHGVPSDVAGQKLLVKKGQIIFGKRRAYQRKVAVADWDCICSAHAMVLEAIPGKILPEFLPFFMQSNQFMERAVEISEGSLSPTIKWKVLEQQVFKIPKTSSQERVISIFKQINDCQYNVNSSIEALQKARETYYEKVFLQGNVKCLRDICHIKTGATPSRSNEKYWDNGHINWMSSGEVNQKRVINTKEKITQLGLDNSNTKIFPMKTVMLAMNGQGKTRGTVAITEIETTCNQSLAALLVKKEFLQPDYLFYYLEGQYQNIRNLTGEGRNGLNLKLIGDIEMPIKPINEQVQICSVMKEFDQLFELLNRKTYILNASMASVINSDSV